MLFLNRKTFLISSACALFLLAVCTVLTLLDDKPSLFSIVILLLSLSMCSGLTAAWIKDDMIRVSGLTGGILLAELCRYAYLLEQYLDIGASSIVASGFVSCLIFIAELMAGFVIMMVTYNHFTTFLKKTAGAQS